MPTCGSKEWTGPISDNCSTEEGFPGPDEDHEVNGRHFVNQAKMSDS